jgi:hypothetical protein
MTSKRYLRPLEVPKAGYPIGKSKLFELISEGRLPAFKFGKSTFLLAEDLDKFFASMPRVTPRRPADDAQHDDE